MAQIAQLVAVYLPGAINTVLYAINDRGQIVGEYDGHGFLYAHGQFTTLAVPFAGATW